jgi:hypothetical protein
MNAILPNNPYARAVETSEPHIVMDRRGFPVDLSGDRWELNEPTTKIVLDWTTLGFVDKA